MARFSSTRQGVGMLKAVKIAHTVDLNRFRSPGVHTTKRILWTAVLSERYLEGNSYRTNATKSVFDLSRLPPPKFLETELRHEGT